MKSIATTGLAAIVLALVSVPSFAAPGGGVAGALYTMTNDPAGNDILYYDRFADGSLEFVDAYGTGGEGSGDGLGNQFGVVLSANGRWLLAVNAGSNEISVFSTAGGDLELTDTMSSYGTRPVSVAIHGDLVYVVNAGTLNIAGFRLSVEGELEFLTDSDLSLSGAGPAQIGFSPAGRFLLVTEKASNAIEVFSLDEDGVADGPGNSVPSAGVTPFAFEFGRRNMVFVSEVFGGAEDLGAVSSYQLGPNGMLFTINGSVPNTETAPCWLVVTKGGRYVFTTNTPDDSLSSYAIGAQGDLSLVDANGRTGEPGLGTRPLDMDLSDDGRFLYTLNIGDNTISTFRVGPNGSLEHLGTIGGVPIGVNGLAAR